LRTRPVRSARRLAVVAEADHQVDRERRDQLAAFSVVTHDRLEAFEAGINPGIKLSDSQRPSGTQPGTSST
jgi:hypothetical protein